MAKLFKLFVSISSTSATVDNGIVMWWTSRWRGKISEPSLCWSMYFFHFLAVSSFLCWCVEKVCFQNSLASRDGMWHRDAQSKMPERIRVCHVTRHTNCNINPDSIWWQNNETHCARMQYCTANLLSIRHYIEQARITCQTTEMSAMYSIRARRRQLCSAMAEKLNRPLINRKNDWTADAIHHPISSEEPPGKTLISSATCQGVTCCSPSRETLLSIRASITNRRELTGRVKSQWDCVMNSRTRAREMADKRGDDRWPASSISITINDTGHVLGLCPPWKDKSSFATWIDMKNFSLSLSAEHLWRFHSVALEKLFERSRSTSRKNWMAICPGTGKVFICDSAVIPGAPLPLSNKISYLCRWYRRPDAYEYNTSVGRFVYWVCTPAPRPTRVFIKGVKSSPGGHRFKGRSLKRLHASGPHVNSLKRNRARDKSVHNRRQIYCKLWYTRLTTTENRSYL